jgi:ribosomal-protein-alanine N-acetyltransferase
MIRLRQFLSADLNRILDIERASFPARIAFSRAYFERLFQEYPEGFIVAEFKGNVVGYTIGNNSGEIITIAVDPDYRKQGIGKSLADFLIKNYKKRGIQELSIHVRTNNQAGVSFWQNLGFKVEKTIKNYYSNGDDALLLKKEI